MSFNTNTIFIYSEVHMIGRYSRWRIELIVLNIYRRRRREFANRAELLMASIMSEVNAPATHKHNTHLL